MGHRVGCPFSKWPEAWVELPDEWLGRHIGKRDEAVANAIDRGIESSTLIQFAIALALAENWGGIPGLDGPPEKWDFAQVPAEIIGWLNRVIVGSYDECFQVPKASSSQSPNGSSNPAIQAATTEANEPTAAAS